MLASKQMKETIKYIRSSHIQREVMIDLSPSPRDWSNNKFSYIYPRLLATYIQYKISYNP